MTILNDLLKFQKSNKTVIREKETFLTGDQLLKLVGYKQSKLEEYGISTGQIIPIIMDPSIDTIATIFAIMFLGGGYVPIDPSSPKERISFILKDTKSEFVLTDQEYFLLKGKVKIINFKTHEDLDKLKNYPKIRDRSSDDISYIIYTSGSTGKPKGVEITYSNLESFISSYNKTFETKISSTYLLSTALQFDVSVSEIFGWINKKASLQILTRNELNDYKSFPYFVKKYNITHMSSSPSIINVYDEQRINILESSGLKCLLIAGETFPTSLASKLEKLIKKGIVYNCYGPTEATIYATYYNLKKVDIDSEYIPIGKPFSNTFILLEKIKGNMSHEHFELLISGKGIAKGYLNNPEKTSESFITIDGIKYYKTGDLVKYSSDNENLVFIGRKDFQIELNSIRVEPGEIQAQILNTGLIKQCLISKIDNILTCIYVSKEEIDINMLKTILSEKIPKYMIPNRWIFVDEFPLNINGKIDRNALNSLVQKRGTSASEVHKNTTEKKDPILMKIREICNVDYIRENDNFFDYGMDSLNATQMEMELEKLYKTKIPNGYLYSHPTVAKLKKSLENDDSSSKICDSNVLNEYLLKKYGISLSTSNENTRKIIYIRTPDTNFEHLKTALNDDKYFCDFIKQSDEVRFGSKEKNLSFFKNEIKSSISIEYGKEKLDRNYESSIFQKVYEAISLNSFTVSISDFSDDFLGNKTRNLISFMLDNIEAFSTKMIREHGKLTSKVYSIKSVAVQIRDLTTFSEKNQTKFIDEEIMANESRIMMSLENNELFSILPFRITPTKIKLVFILHHAISDGASDSIIKQHIGYFFNKRNVQSLKMKDYLEELSINSNVKSILNEPTILKIKSIREKEKIPKFIGNIFKKDYLIIRVPKSLDNWQKMMIVANEVTKQYLNLSKTNIMTFQILFNFRKVHDKHFYTLVNDCHETATYYRKKGKEDLQFMNDLFYHIHEFHFNRGISNGMAIYNNFPNFTDDQKNLQHIIENAPINIDFLGEINEENVSKMKEEVKVLKKQLKNLKKQLRFTAFSSSGSIYIYQVNSL